MNDGYVKLWRKSLNSAVWHNPKLWRFWTYCLMQASHRKHTALVGMQDVELEPGQFIFTLRNAAQDTGLSLRMIRNCLFTAQKLEILTIKTTNKFSVVTLVNWAKYQGDDKESDTQNDKQRANKGQTKDTSTRMERINTEKKKYKIGFNFTSGEWENITSEDLAIWRKAYPAVDLDLQLSQAAAWLSANPSKKKSDYKRFLNGWFKRHQDRGGDVPTNRPQQQIQPKTYAQAQDAERRQRAMRVLQSYGDDDGNITGNPGRVGQVGNSLPAGQSK